MKPSLWLALILLMSISCRSEVSGKKDEQKKIDGTWLPATAELGGEPFPEEIRKTIKLVVADGTYSVTVGDKPDKGVLKLDPSQKPMTLDISGTEGPNKGKSIPAIYELSDDTLRICYDLSGTTRPTEFKTAKGTQQFLVTYKRKKP